MVELVRKVERNLRDRINAVPDLITTPIDTVAEGIDKLLELKPVKAVTTIGKKIGDGAIRFVEKQAEITRRWLGGY